MLDEITTIDNALTRPWTVTKRYRRERNPIWYQNDCSETITTSPSARRTIS